MHIERCPPGSGRGTMEFAILKDGIDAIVPLSFQSNREWTRVSGSRTSMTRFNGARFNRIGNGWIVWLRRPLKRGFNGARVRHDN